MHHSFSLLGHLPFPHGVYEESLNLCNQRDGNKCYFYGYDLKRMKSDRYVVKKKQITFWVFLFTFRCKNYSLIMFNFDTCLFTCLWFSYFSSFNYSNFRPFIQLYYALFSNSIPNMLSSVMASLLQPVSSEHLYFKRYK